MSSLDVVKAHHVTTTEQQLSETSNRISDGLAQLVRIRDFVRACQAVQGPKVPELDYSAALTTEQSAFVENNHIANGHEFDVASLLSPFEDVTPQPTTQPIQQSSLRPPSPSRARSPLSPISNPSRGAQAQDRISPAPIALKNEPAGATANAPKAVTDTPTPPRSPRAAANEDAESVAVQQLNATSEPSRTNDPPRNLHPTASAVSPDLRTPMTTLPGPKERTSKVLHLPPKEQQEQHVREVERAHAAQRQKERKEDEHGLGLSVNVSNADLVSSPSSTAGAYSTSTPKPAQHSPDTSPDADYTHEERERLRQASLDQLVKGKDNAMDMTPDAQLRREEEQAGAQSEQERKSEREMQSERDRQSLDAGFAKAQLDLQTPKAPARRRTDNLEIDMNDAPSSMNTPMQPPNTDGMQRRMTRVASGAMRQKSVSEILGEAPKLTSSTSALSRRESFGALMSDGDRSKHSMVVFSKGDQSHSPNRNSRLEPDGYLALRGAQDDADKDYLRPLFLHQAYQPPRAQTLSDLIQSAHKTLTTTNMYANIREGFDYRILRRIYHLQNANKWAFRQMAKFPDPAPQTSHMDHVLAEMKWMRTDFREERKWKQAGARRLAEACATYVNSSEDVRSTMRIKARIPPRPGSQDTMEGIEEPPELDPSGSTDSGDSLADDEIVPFPTLSTVAPAALFNLGYDDVVFEIDDSPASDGILQELPMYESKPLEPSPFNNTRNSLIPVSKYVTGKLVPKPAQILRKRSRYEYESEDEEPVSRPTSSKRRASEVSMFLSPARRSPKRREISPEAADVALFDPINRHIRDRLHANHAFRPPSEFPMPATSFFEWRQNSQWTWDEDQKLRNAVKKFSYNWSLIAMDLQQFSQPSMFVAAQERRTPWECFERWEQLEGLPNDMDKTSYFRTYRSRIQAANRNVEARAQAAQQLASQNGNTMTVRRRTETNPFRVQRRKDDRHMMMIGAITKLQRKRETHQHRQLESAKAAALRKQHNDANQNKNGNIHTPQEFSRMKHEREQKILERQEMYRQQLMQAQQAKVAQMQANMRGGGGGGQPGQGQGMPNGGQQRATSSGSQGQQPQMVNGHQNPQQQNGGNIPRPNSQGMMQNGFPQQGMQGMQMPNGAQMQGQQRPMNPQTQQDMRMLMAQRQAYAMQAQQAGGAGGNNAVNNLAAAHLAGQMGTPQMQLAAAMAAQQRNQQNATSPRAQGQGANQNSNNGQYAQQGGQANQLSSGYQPALLMHQQRVMQEFPHYTPQQVLQTANERLKSQMAQMQRNAMSAASGQSGNQQSPAGGNSATPQQQMTNNMMMQQNLQMLAQANNNSAGGNNQYGVASTPTPGPAGQGSQSPQQQYANAMARSQLSHARMGSGSPGMGVAMPVQQQGAGGSRSATPARPGSSMATQQGQGGGGSPAL